jgi:hypothetical protein
MASPRLAERREIADSDIRPTAMTVSRTMSERVITRANPRGCGRLDGFECRKCFMGLELGFRGIGLTESTIALERTA